MMLLNNLLRITILAGVLFVFHAVWPQDGAVDLIDTQTAGSTSETVLKEAPFVAQENTSLEAKSACIFDVLKNEFVFEKNIDSQLPLASLTKLMTATVAQENFLSGTLVPFSEDLWPIDDITRAMLIASSNEAALAIASVRSDFIDLMNRKAKKMGLRQTYFLNPTGLDISDNLAGAYGSCRDVAKMMEYILLGHRDILEITTKGEYAKKGIKFENTNKILAELPTLLGGKTGFDDLAGGNLVVAVDKGLHHPIIIVALGSSIEGRFRDVKTLYDTFVK